MTGVGGPCYIAPACTALERARRMAAALLERGAYSAELLARSVLLIDARGEIPIIVPGSRAEALRTLPADVCAIIRETPAGSVPVIALERGERGDQVHAGHFHRMCAGGDA